MPFQVTWRRHLIRAPEGKALLVGDYSGQELGIAACLSGDERLAEIYRASDPHMAMAVLLGLAPAGATKKMHKEVRDAAKVVNLAAQYGAGYHMVVGLTGMKDAQAKVLLANHKATFPTFWAWRQSVIDEALINNKLATLGGWPLHVEPGYNVRSLANFPVQGNASEVLRVAVIRLTDAGFKVIATIHDACMVEIEDDGNIDIRKREVEGIMRDAGMAVLGGGMVLKVDFTVVRGGQRWVQEKGVEHWQWLVEQLRQLRVEVQNP